MAIAARLAWPIAALLAGALLGPAEARAESPQLRARALMREAQALAGRKQGPQAADKIETALRLAPQDAELWRLAGACYDLLNERRLAQARYRTYLERCPACPEAEGVRALLEERATLGGEADPERLGKHPRATSRSAADEERAGEMLALAEELPGRKELATALALRALELAPEASPEIARAEGFLKGLHGTLKAARAQAAKQKALLQRTYDEAYKLRVSDPDQAHELCDVLLQLAPRGGALRAKVERLLPQLKRD
jgi:hypothetical protein